MILYTEGKNVIRQYDVLQIRLSTSVWADCTILNTPEAARLAYIKTQVPSGSLYRIQARFSRAEVAKIIHYVRNNPVLGDIERRNAIAKLMRKYGRNHASV